MNDFKHNPMYRYLVVLTISAMVGLQTWRTIFNNFAVEAAFLEGHQIGLIQSVREIPGIVAIFAVFTLLLIKEHRLSALSIILCGFGLATTGFFPSFFGLILTTLTMSVGFHFFQVTGPSLTLQYFDKQKSPLVIGKLRSLAAASNVGIGILIYFSSPVLSFAQLYIIIGCLILAAGFWAIFQNPADRNIVSQRKKIFFRKKYFLYYFLRFMAGTRRQTFIAFALFLLVKKFHLTLQIIAVLFMINNVLNFFLSPYIGKSINRFGEKKILTLESIALTVIFLAFTILKVKIILIFFYILGSIIFYNIPPIAIRTYFQKVGDPQDTASTMATGSTINHISTVIAPAIGGFLWMIDFRIPFWLGSVLSVVSLLAAQKIQTIASEPDFHGLDPTQPVKRHFGRGRSHD
jgi:predicted MFS family arabinose efflux permease